MTGGKVAGPIWKAFMDAAMEEYPVREFMIPEDIVFVTVNPSTGNIVKPDTPGAWPEAFLKGTEAAVYEITQIGVGPLARASNADS